MEQKLDISQLNIGENILNKLAKNNSKPDDIYSSCIDKYNQDLESMGELLQKFKIYDSFASNSPEPKDYPFPRCSNVMYPLISTAKVTFSALWKNLFYAQGEICKPKVIGYDDGELMIDNSGEVIINPDTEQPMLANVGKKRKKADRVATYINYQLDKGICGAKRVFNGLAMPLCVYGTMFVKITWDDISEEAAMSLIYPENLIINRSATYSDFEYHTKTEVIYRTEQQIKEKVSSGIFSSDILTVLDSGSKTGSYKFLDQHCFLDLDEDGVDEPYLVIMSEDVAKIAGIYPLYSKEGIIKKDGKIVKVEGLVSYIPFNLFPDAKGRIHGEGLASLLYNSNSMINSSINQIFDGGHMSLAPRGFVDGGAGIREGIVRLQPFEFKTLTATQGDINNKIAMIPSPAPNPLLLNLLQELISAAKTLGSFGNIVDANLAANIQPTTLFAIIDSSNSIVKSVFIDLFDGIKSILNLIFDLDATYLSEKKYLDVLNTTTRYVNKEEDFDLSDYDIDVVFDPNDLTYFAKAAKVSFLTTLIGNPNINQTELMREIITLSGYEDPEKFVAIPNQAPSVEQTLAQAELQKSEARIKELQLKEVELQSNLGKAAVDLEKIVAETENIRANTAAIVSKVQLDTVAEIRKERQNISELVLNNPFKDKGGTNLLD